jgi:hypothetical protein
VDLEVQESNLGMNIYYMFWQLACWWKCRSLVDELEVDIAHHVSFMSLTRGSFVPFLGVKSVIGPIGGLQTVPKAGKSSHKKSHDGGYSNSGRKVFPF